MSVSGKTALITGASYGIGAEAARIFAKAGVNVCLFARSGHVIEALADEIGSPALAIEGDVRIFNNLETAVIACRDKFGCLDILINNAGVVEPIMHMNHSSYIDWDHVIDINLKGVYHGMRAALPHMKAHGGGTVLTVSSGAAHSPVEAWSHYCASKAGAAMLTRCLDKEERANGIRAIGLSPGTVATPMQRTIKASGINPVSQLDWNDHIPATWPARALLWLCSSDGDEFIGQEVSLRDEAIRRRIGLTN
ncbi:MAG: SDR family oxidoreductase [Aestuariivita sp.]|nr:SDR family oxidoreductase [Aestuariivita sp.]